MLTFPNKIFYDYIQAVYRTFYVLFVIQFYSDILGCLGPKIGTIKPALKRKRFHNTQSNRFLGGGRKKCLFHIHDPNIQGDLHN